MSAYPKYQGHAALLSMASGIICQEVATFKIGWALIAKSNTQFFNTIFLSFHLDNVCKLITKQQKQFILQVRIYSIRADKVIKSNGGSIYYLTHCFDSSLKQPPFVKDGHSLTKTTTTELIT